MSFFQFHLEKRKEKLKKMLCPNATSKLVPFLLFVYIWYPGDVTRPRALLSGPQRRIWMAGDARRWRRRLQAVLPLRCPWDFACAVPEVRRLPPATHCWRDGLVPPARMVFHTNTWWGLFISAVEWVLYSVYFEVSPSERCSCPCVCSFWHTALCSAHQSGGVWRVCVLYACHLPISTLFTFAHFAPKCVLLRLYKM